MFRNFYFYKSSIEILFYRLVQKIVSPLSALDPERIILSCYLKIFLAGNTWLRNNTNFYNVN